MLEGYLFSTLARLTRAKSGLLHTMSLKLDQESIEDTGNAA